MKIGDWDLSRDEVEDITCVSLSIAEARNLLDGKEHENFDNALDEAQGEAKEFGRSEYILIRVR